MSFVKNSLIIWFAVLALNVTRVDSKISDPKRELYGSTIEERVAIQKSTIHWLPYKRIMYHVESDGEFTQDVCRERPSSIDEFPKGFWTREQRLMGLFMVHILIAVYLFIVLAFICDKYFLPTVERICEALNISPDVAATTFMATATTIPEFFANTISTFIAESDMGLSAIIGSMMFNTLGVAACASLFTKKPIQIDWWPITRDAILLSINITILVVMAWDGVIMWYETCILVTLYVGYWVLMFQNPRIMKFVKHIIEDKFMWCQRIKNYDITNQRPFPTKLDGQSGTVNPSYTVSVIDVRSKPGNDDEPQPRRLSLSERRQSTDLSVIYNQEDDDEFNIWELPRGVSKFDMFWYFLTWPIRFMLHYTIPNPITHKKWFPVSFLMCVVWIAIVSYLIFWMVVIVGDTFGIPEPIMGLTFLAFGGCMPEAISAVIVARKGSGQMGVSNALGANSLAILFSLGLPWFIRTMASGAGSTGAYIHIYSHGIEYTIMSLLLAVAVLYIVMAAAGYKLRKTVGAVLSISYCCIATFAILVELDILFESSNNC